MTPGCHLCAVMKQRCDQCRRRMAWGTILGVVERWVKERNGDGADLDRNEALEAVAYLMQDRVALVHQHRKDMRDEQREAQRGARESFDEGRADGQRDRGDW